MCILEISLTESEL